MTDPVDPIEQIYSNIRETFTDMSEDELQVEFLTQMWLAATMEKMVIHKVEREDSVAYFFVGKSLVLDEEIPGVPIKPSQYFHEALKELLIDAVDLGYVHVVANTIKNSHELDMNDIFISKSREDAKEFILKLVSIDDVGSI